MQKLLQKKFLIPFYVIGSFLLVVAIVKAATTIGTNISTDGALNVTGVTTLSNNIYSTGGALFNQASTTAFQIEMGNGSDALVVNTGDGTNTNATTTVTGFLQVSGGTYGTSGSMPGFTPVASSTVISAGSVWIPSGGGIYLGNFNGTSYQKILTRETGNNFVSFGNTSGHRQIITNSSANMQLGDSDGSSFSDMRYGGATMGHVGVHNSMSSGVTGFTIRAGASQGTTPYAVIETYGGVDDFTFGSDGRLGIGASTIGAMLHASTTDESTVGIRVTHSGTSPTANMFELQSQAGTFFSGFTASGGLLMNIASTTAINVQDGSGNKVFEIDTSSTLKGVTITGQATTTSNFIVGTSSWAAPTNTVTVVGTHYVTGNATTSGDFVVGNRSTSGTTSVDIMSGAAGSGNACISMRREGADYRVYINSAGTGLVVEAGECE